MLKVNKTLSSSALVLSSALLLSACLDETTTPTPDNGNGGNASPVTLDSVNLQIELPATKANNAPESGNLESSELSSIEILLVTINADGIVQTLVSLTANAQEQADGSYTINHEMEQAPETLIVAVPSNTQLPTVGQALPADVLYTPVTRDDLTLDTLSTLATNAALEFVASGQVSELSSEQFDALVDAIQELSLVLPAPETDPDGVPTQTLAEYLAGLEDDQSVSEAIQKLQQEIDNMLAYAQHLDTKTPADLLKGNGVYLLDPWQMVDNWGFTSAVKQEDDPIPDDGITPYIRLEGIAQDQGQLLKLDTSTNTSTHASYDLSDATQTLNFAALDFSSQLLITHYRSNGQLELITSPAQTFTARDDGSIEARSIPHPEIGSVISGTVSDLSGLKINDYISHGLHHFAVDPQATFSNGAKAINYTIRNIGDRYFKLTDLSDDVTDADLQSEIRTSPYYSSTPGPCHPDVLVNPGMFVEFYESSFYQLIDDQTAQLVLAELDPSNGEYACHVTAVTTWERIEHSVDSIEYRIKRPEGIQFADVFPYQYLNVQPGLNSRGMFLPDGYESISPDYEWPLTSMSYPVSNEFFSRYMYNQQAMDDILSNPRVVIRNNRIKTSIFGLFVQLDQCTNQDAPDEAMTHVLKYEYLPASEGEPASTTYEIAFSDVYSNYSYATQTVTEDNGNCTVTDNPQDHGITPDASVNNLAPTLSASEIEATLQAVDAGMTFQVTLQSANEFTLVVNQGQADEVTYHARRLVDAQ